MLLMTKSVFGMTSHYEMHLGFRKKFQKKIIAVIKLPATYPHENI